MLDAAQSGGTEVVVDDTLTQSGQAADAKKTGDEISAIKADLADNVNDLKSVFNELTENNAFTFSIKYTRSKLGAERFFFLYPFMTGTEYIVNVKINAIPQKNHTAAQFAYTTSSTLTSDGKVDIIVPDLKDISAGFEKEFHFIPTANALYSYVYINCNTGDVDIDVTIKVFSAMPHNNVEAFKRVAFLPGIEDSAQRIFFPFKMVSGEKYNFRTYIHTPVISPADNSIKKTYCAVSAVTLTGNGGSYDVHDTIVRIRHPQSESVLINFDMWNDIEYTALHDSEYIEIYLIDHFEGGYVALEAKDGEHGLANYVYTTDFSIKNHGGRMIYNTKPYPFKRIGSYSGSGQGIVEKNGDIFVFTNGIMYRYRNLSVVSNSTLFAHPINASIMHNGNILISDITDYNTENEVRHVYEYNPDTDTIINDYAPKVANKHLVLSEEIDSNVLLVAYKDDQETAHIIYWYSYDIANDLITYISETVHDRVYTQGCSLRGDLVYVMTNNISTSDNAPAKMIVVDLVTGEIKKELIFRGFGETEGFFITYSETPGTYAFMLDNGDNYIYLVKLV